MNADFARAQMLISQGRFDMAERELRQQLGEHPDESVLHSMLAICVVQDEKRYEEATREAQQAVTLQPDQPYGHYIHSLIQWKRNRLEKAYEAIAEAIRLDPYDADFFAQAGQIHLARRDWRSTLDFAEQGLQIDPEHSMCNNLRTIALERLGRGAEAVDSAAANLKTHPDNSYAHSAHGWALLNSGQHAKAQDAFRESLRLDPTNDAARDGMIDAINSRSRLFRSVRAFHVGLSRLSRKYQFALIFGGWILIQVLSRLGARVPAIEPFVLPLIMLYLIFAVLTWTSDAIFNAFLRLHPFGRHLLRQKQIWQSNLVTACLICAVVGASYAALHSWWDSAVTTGFYWVLMCVPATVPFLMPTQKRALILAVAGIAIGLLPVYGIIRAVLQSTACGPATQSIQIFVWSIIGLQVAANFMAVAPNRQ